MTPFDRAVRARIYDLFVGGARRVDGAALAADGDWDPEEVAASLRRLADEHRIALTVEGDVAMAHPFSGVPTGYRAVIGDDWWQANCAWDALAILALLGDGVARGPDGLVWEVEDGRVHPEGIVHLLVPAFRFWDDVVFT